jgi:hypothetical protein
MSGEGLFVRIGAAPRSSASLNLNAPNRHQGFNSSLNR